MPSVFDQLGSLISGVLHTITAAIGSVLAVVQSLLNAIVGLIGTAFAALGTAISGIAQTFEGLVKFLLGNIVVIGALIAAYFVYTMLVTRSGAATRTKKVK